MKKRGILILMVLLLAAACFFGWYRQELNLADRIPQESWVRAEVRYGTPGEGDSETDFDDLQALLAAIDHTTVTRRSEFDGYLTPYFRITLYKGEAYPTLITVGEDGSIAIAAGLDFDHYSYYRDGEELYQALLDLAAP